ncbi:N-terminal fungal transcription regulatory domain-containing protein [Metarhizium guizhouense ARSEF 977]|uniref:N-terminal fungal transcription regulatory domain-containing protein n=1 Tax=Metarhizium guizhouense (strain ARSEF 977) TaxID=1276136 RepID=A0A0B4H1X3_METGA|nr:N-terminal fungal transcription regulatory domain-containing protein [Metarhizium guizhouense ARSEF 977]
MPTKEALQYIEGLKDEEDALTILSTLRKGLSCRQTEVDNSTAVPVSNDDDKPTPQEWQIQNPIAYPGTAGRDTNLFQKDPYRGLTKSPGHDFHADTSNPSSLIPDPRSAKLCNDTARYEYEEPHELCDSRLRKLNIRHWTNVDIDDDLAAKCISLYLETDHPLLGHFDAELFVSHLILEQSSDYCTPLLVNSLLYWACQMYSAIDPQTDQIAIRFCTEAESHWTAERHKGNDSILILAATEFLCLGYLGQGRDHVVLRYLTEAADMAGRMGLFNTEGQVSGMETSSYSNLAGAAKTSHMYAAWGIFNWLTNGLSKFPSTYSDSKKGHAGYIPLWFFPQ